MHTYTEAKIKQPFLNDPFQDFQQQNHHHQQQQKGKTKQNQKPKTKTKTHFILGHLHFYHWEIKKIVFTES